jgi:hypothetical protein
MIETSRALVRCAMCDVDLVRAPALTFKYKVQPNPNVTP